MKAMTVNHNVSDSVRTVSPVSRRSFLKGGLALAAAAAFPVLMPEKLMTKASAAPAIPNIYYCTHVQNIGWTTSVTNGSTSGTTGRSLRVEAMQVDISGYSVQGRGHVQNIGWQSWVGNKQTIGTTGRGLRLEAVQLKLTGTAANYWDIQYRAHVQNIGWQNWVKNGETAGTVGQSLRIEAIQIRLVVKSSSTSSSGWAAPMTNMYVCGNDFVQYYSARPSRPYHCGIDVASRTGDTKVYAAATGKVTYSGWNDANGNYVVLQHTLNGSTVYSFYCHLASRTVSAGASVTRGQQIGVMGNTGSGSAGKHLHFAIVNKAKTGSYYGYVDKYNAAGTKAWISSDTSTIYYSPYYVLNNQRLPG